MLLPVFSIIAIYIKKPSLFY